MGFSIVWGRALEVLMYVAAQTPPAPVEVTPVIEREVAAQIDLVGSVEPLRRSVVASGALGLVTAFDVNEGDYVKAGQELARLRTRTLEIQKAAAAAVLAQAKQELAELEAGSRPEEIERARAALAAAEARARWALTRQQRVQSLVSRDAASEDQLEDVVSLLDQSREDVARLKADYELMRLGPRAEKKAQARARVQEAEAELNRVEDDIEKRIVRAPFDGYVVAEHTEVGQWLDEKAPVVELVDLSTIEVQIMVPERYITVLRAGAAVTTQVDAAGEKPFEGMVARIVPQGDAESRHFPVKIRVPNRLDGQRPVLQAGMSAMVRMPVGERRKSLLVPKDALVLQAGKSVVYVVDAKSDPPSAVAVSVVPGAAHDSLTEIRGNLRVGQQVVVRGNERLTPGQALKIVESDGH
jgi:RND family efflux transporter MFP subunit